MEPTSGWKPLPKLIEQHEDDEKRIADTLKQVEAYWNAIAPYGAPVFDIGRGMELLLYDVSQYRNALNRIAAKPVEHEALMKHREESGQEVPESDRQRWFAYLDVAHIASQALSHDPPSENADARQQ